MCLRREAHCFPRLSGNTCKLVEGCIKPKDDGPINVIPSSDSLLALLKLNQTVNIITRLTPMATFQSPPPAYYPPKFPAMNQLPKRPSTQSVPSARLPHFNPTQPLSPDQVKYVKAVSGVSAFLLWSSLSDACKLLFYSITVLLASTTLHHARTISPAPFQDAPTSLTILTRSSSNSTSTRSPLMVPSAQSAPTGSSLGRQRTATCALVLVSTSATKYNNSRC